ncbi:MAG: tetratricopeptide repeat protein [Geminicoccales bacterium]
MRTIGQSSVLIAALSALLLGCSPTAEVRVATSEVSLTEELSFQQARTLVDSGKVPEAITAFRKLLRVSGPSLPVLNGLAIAYAEFGRPDLAARYFAEALALAPDDPATLNNIGFAALRRKDVDLARHYLERAERAGGDAPTVRRNLEIVAHLDVSGLRSPAADTALTREPEDKAFSDRKVIKVERRTASSIRLSGMPADPPNVKPLIADRPKEPSSQPGARCCHDPVF